jgi:two-component system sensor histidine kinase KdpD
MTKHHRTILQLRGSWGRPELGQPPGSQNFASDEAKGPATNGTPADTAVTARVLVCICEYPAIQQIIRSAAQIATERRAELYALYVELPGNSTRCRPAAAAQFANNLRLAHDLGAQVERVCSHRVAQSILQFASDHRIDTIVLGRSNHTRRWLLGGDVADRVQRACGAIEVRVIVEES